VNKERLRLISLMALPRKSKESGLPLASAERLAFPREHQKIFRGCASARRRSLRSHLNEAWRAASRNP